MVDSTLKLSIRCLAAFIEVGTADKAQRADAAWLLREFAEGKSLADLSGDARRRGRPTDPRQFEMAYRVEELMLPPSRWPDGQGLNVMEAWRVVAEEQCTSVDNVRKAHKKHKAPAEELAKQLWVFDPNASLD